MSDDKTKRSKRRADHRRMIDKVDRFMRDNGLGPNSNWDRAVGGKRDYAKYCRKRAENRAPCSCYMCGNPRRHKAENPKTRQEIKADLRVNDEG